MDWGSSPAFRPCFDLNCALGIIKPATADIRYMCNVKLSNQAQAQCKWVLLTRVKCGTAAAIRGRWSGKANKKKLLQRNKAIIKAQAEAKRPIPQSALLKQAKGDHQSLAQAEAWRPFNTPSW